jgi:hypothetical protein
VSYAKLALVGTAVLFVPPLVGLELPGGVLAAEGVEVDPEDIVIHTWPWALSIALVTWLVLRKGSDWDLELFVYSGFVIVAGAAVGYALSAPMRKAADDVQLEFGPVDFLWENELSRTLAEGSWGGRLALLALMVIGVLLLYAILYGLPLWIAGLICGVLLGRTLHAAFPSKPTPPTATTVADGGTQRAPSSPSAD